MWIDSALGGGRSWQVQRPSRSGVQRREHYRSSGYVTSKRASETRLTRHSIAIQFLRLSGFSPLITTSSLHNADYLKQLGATHVLDRKLSPQEISTEIRKITSEPITTIFDAAGIPETQNLGYDLLASGGAIAVVLPEAVDPQKKVEDKTAFFMHADVTMPQNRKLGTSLFSALPGLLESGDLKVCLRLCLTFAVALLISLAQPNRFEVVPNGLEGIMAGLETLKKGVSCVKLIVHPQEGL